MRKLFVLALFALVLVVPRTSLAASLSLSPASGSYTVGNQIIVKVLASSGIPMNAAEGVLSFPSSILSIVSISKNNSILNFWPIEPSISPSSGTASFEGVTTSGFQGSAGTVVTVVLRAVGEGEGTVSFQSGKVLANDGQGTDITSSLSGATFTIRAASPPPSPTPSSQGVGLFTRITSSTHPIQTKWYARPHVVLDWTNTQGVTAVRLGYDADAGGIPTVLYDEPLSHKELDLKDGIWYFHLQERGPGGWGPVNTFRIQIDTVPPAPITLQFPNGTTATGASLAVSFTTTDELSGIDHYKIMIDGRSLAVTEQEGSGIYALSAQDAGNHVLGVEAYDKAGNSVKTDGSFTIVGKEASSNSLFYALIWFILNYFSFILIVLAALAILAYILWYLWHHFHAFRRRFPGATRHSHQVVREQFKELTEAVVDEVMSLENVRSKRELTYEEKRIISNLKALIEKTEFSIENTIVGKEW